MHAYAETWHIWNLECSKPIHACILTHIQNSVIFTEIGKPCVTQEIQDPVIVAILEYSKP